MHSASRDTVSEYDVIAERHCYKVAQNCKFGKEVLL